MTLPLNCSHNFIKFLYFLLISYLIKITRYIIINIISHYFMLIYKSTNQDRLTSFTKKLKHQKIQNTQNIVINHTFQTTFSSLQQAVLQHEDGQIHFYPCAHLQFYTQSALTAQHPPFVLSQHSFTQAQSLVVVQSQHLVAQHPPFVLSQHSLGH